MRQKKKNYTDEEWVKDIRAMIEQRVEMLRSEIMSKEEALSKAPVGSLRAIRYGNTYQYFKRTDPKDSHGVYIKRKDNRIAQALAQKGYNKKFVEEAVRELNILDEYLKKIDPGSLGKIYDNLHEGKKLLVAPVFEEEKTYRENWESVTYSPGYFEPNSQEHYTAKRERVRSKVEINIANMLNMYGVPYRYEYPLELDGRELRPDFLCLNVRTRKEYIWEHFGMMDLESYALKNVNKINMYMENGYFPGDNMIMTFETSTRVLSTVLMKDIIEKYLL